MGKNRNKSLILFGVGFLLALAMVIGGSKAWKQYRSTHSKMEAEIIYCYPNDGLVLAAQVGNEYGSLFTFSWPEKNADPELKCAGMVVELTGPEELLLTYPMQYGPVLAVKKTGQREDFIEEHYFTLRRELKGKDEKAVGAAIDALDCLNDEEREGLDYLLKSYLKLGV